MSRLLALSSCALLLSGTALARGPLGAMTLQHTVTAQQTKSRVANALRRIGKRFPQAKAAFAKPAYIPVGESVGEHSSKVALGMARQLRGRHLPHRVGKLRVSRTAMLAAKLHDLGKGLAVEARVPDAEAKQDLVARIIARRPISRANRRIAAEIFTGIRDQNRFTLPLLETIFGAQGFSQKEFRLARDLVGQDLVGRLQTGKLDAAGAKKSLATTAGETGLTVPLLMELHLAFHAADAGAHPALEGELYKTAAGVQEARPSWSLGNVEAWAKKGH